MHRHKSRDRKSKSQKQDINQSRDESIIAYDLNTLTSMQGFYRVFGSVPVGRLPGTVKGPFKALRYCLKD